jgi:Flp pilus assembly protein TadG
MTMSAVSRSLLRLRRDERGVTAVIVALTLPLLFAFGALAINSGLWFTIKRENQSAADAAAISAAYELMAGPKDACTDPNFANFRADRLTPAAAQAVAANQHAGWDNTVTNTTVTCPYTDSLLATEFPNGYQAVSVTLQQDQSSLFAFAPLTSATIATSAVAAVSPTQNGCILGLKSTNQNVTISGSGTVDAPGCVVASDSNNAQSITVSGGLTAQSILTHGNVSVTGGGTLTLTSPAIVNATAPADPYASQVASISLPASCGPALIVNTAAAPPHGCYTGMTFETRANVTLTGVYFVAGSFTIQDTATVIGTDVTFVVYNGSITIQGGPTVKLSAPPSGGNPYQGLLFYMVATDANNTSVAGCVDPCTLTGAIYVPGSDLVFSGNSSSSSCTVLVASTITFSGSVTLNSSGCKALGVTEVTTNVVVLAQ